MARLEKLMEIDDESTFREGLEKEFGMRPDDPRFEKAMNAWREALDAFIFFLFRQAAFAHMFFDHGCDLASSLSPALRVGF